jgi:hypothetical protein
MNGSLVMGHHGTFRQRGPTGAEVAFFAVPSAGNPGFDFEQFGSPPGKPGYARNY